MKANPPALKRARERSGLKQSELATIAGLRSQGQYSLIERGVTGTTYARFCKIAKKLKVDVDTLIADEYAEVSA